ncbi:MAG: hypothetical protein CMO80_10915 [Verrucomicrobiales bacterium]|nr:hypothetical protein [Verrucomicrobiales bacterium]
MTDSQAVRATWPIVCQGLRDAQERRTLKTRARRGKGKWDGFNNVAFQAKQWFAHALFVNIANELFNRADQSPSKAKCPPESLELCSHAQCCL